MRLFKKHAKDESGAVTVDWVVLTAAVVGIAILIMTAIRDGSTGLSDSIWAYMDSLDLFN